MVFEVLYFEFDRYMQIVVLHFKYNKAQYVFFSFSCVIICTLFQGALHGLISPYSTLVESFVKGVLDEAEFEVKPNMDQGDLIQV
jgi:hypothetical protein